MHAYQLTWPNLVDKSMRITMSTPVDGYYVDVMKRFDRDLFEALAPPVGMTVDTFTGSKKGDTVVLKFTIPYKFIWQSDIIEDGHNEDRAWFVDVGKILPWPLKTWRHEHIVQKVNNHQSIIIDQMEYTCRSAWMNQLIKPVLYAAFNPRKKIYKQYFSNSNNKAE